jgi:hypothetical protein
MGSEICEVFRFLVPQVAGERACFSTKALSFVIPELAPEVKLVKLKDIAVVNGGT